MYNPALFTISIRMYCIINTFKCELKIILYRTEKKNSWIQISQVKLCAYAYSTV